MKKEMLLNNSMLMKSINASLKPSVIDAVSLVIEEVLFVTFRPIEYKISNCIAPNYQRPNQNHASTNCLSYSIGNYNKTVFLSSFVATPLA